MPYRRQQCTLVIENRCGECKVARISKDFRLVDVDMGFGGVELNFDKGAAFELIGEAKFGGIDLPRNAKITQEVKEHTSYKVKASIGKAPSSKVQIDMKYGGADISLN